MSFTNESCQNSCPIGYPKKSSLKNFSLSLEPFSYDSLFLLNHSGDEDPQFSSHVASNFPDIFTSISMPPFAQIPFTEEEERAIAAQSFNTHKRISQNRNSHMNSTPSSTGSSSSATGGSSSNIPPSNRRHHQQHPNNNPYHNRTSSNNRNGYNQNGSNNGAVAAGMDDMKNNFHRSNDSSFYHSKSSSSSDPWNAPVRNEVGNFDENGVFSSHPSSSVVSSSCTNPLSSSMPIENYPDQSIHQPPSNTKNSTVPVFERLRESGSASTTTASQLLHSDPAIISISPQNSNSSKSAILSQSIHQHPHSQQHQHQHLPNAFHQNLTISSSNTTDDRWLYRDPSGNIQGPFSNREMFEWFQSGYFPPTLPIKRVRDPGFESLGLVIQRLGAIPFSSPPTAAPNLQPVNSNSNIHHTIQKSDAIPNSNLFEKLPSTVIKESEINSKISEWPTEQLPSVFVPDSIILPEKKPLSTVELSASNAHCDVKASASDCDKLHPVSSSLASAAESRELDNPTVKDLKMKPKHAKEMSMQPHLPSNLLWSTTPTTPTAPSLDQIQKEEAAAAAAVIKNQTVPASNAPTSAKKNSLPAAISSATSWKSVISSSTNVSSIEMIRKEEASKSASTSNNSHADKSENSASSLPVNQPQSNRPCSLSEMLQNRIIKSQTSIHPATAITTSEAPKKPKPSNPSNPTTSSKQPISGTSTATNTNSQSSSLIIDWARKELKSFESSIDVGTFVSLLQDLSSSQIRLYCEDVLGPSKGPAFATEFMRRCKGNYSDSNDAANHSKQHEQDSNEYVTVVKKGKKK